jgi:hypothetical protein
MLNLIGMIVYLNCVMLDLSLSLFLNMKDYVLIEMTTAFVLLRNV